MCLINKFSLTRFRKVFVAIAGQLDQAINDERSGFLVKFPTLIHANEQVSQLSSFPWQVRHLFKDYHSSFWTRVLVIEKLDKLLSTDEKKKTCQGKTCHRKLARLFPALCYKINLSSSSFVLFHLVHSVNTERQFIANSTLANSTITMHMHE